MKPLLQEEITEIAIFFKKSTLLQSLPMPLLRRLAGCCQKKTAESGAIIYHKESHPDYLYFIRKGSVAETVRCNKRKTFALRIRNTGDYFGEMGILAECQQPLTILALEPCHLLAIPSSAFREIVWSCPQVCHTLMLQLMDRLSSNARHRIGSMYLNASGRLAMTLLKFTVNTPGHSLRIHLTQQDLAASSGISRQTVTTLLKHWKDDSIISYHRGSIEILDTDSLFSILLESEEQM